MLDAHKQRMVDERVCRILQALEPCDPAAGEEAVILHFLADEWAALEVAAIIVAPVYGLDGTDPAVGERLKQAAHAALKAECLRILGGRFDTELAMREFLEGLP
jgi:hypothetical protein